MDAPIERKRIENPVQAIYMPPKMGQTQKVRAKSNSNHLVNINVVESKEKLAATGLADLGKRSQNAGGQRESQMGDSTRSSHDEPSNNVQA